MYMGEREGRGVPGASSGTGSRRVATLVLDPVFTLGTVEAESGREGDWIGRIPEDGHPREAGEAGGPLFVALTKLDRR